MSKGNNEDLFSTAVRAGKRTYFFDVKATRGNDLFMTITESRRVGPESDGSGHYEKHKLFLYKEDFEGFIKGLEDAIAHIKSLQRTGEYRSTEGSDKILRVEHEMRAELLEQEESGFEKHRVIQNSSSGKSSLSHHLQSGQKAINEMAGTPEPVSVMDVEVSINLPQRHIDPSAITDLEVAVASFMTDLGFTVGNWEEPIHGSFFRRMWFFRKGSKSREEIETLYEQGKQALELKFLDAQTSTITRDLSQSAQSLIQAMEHVDEGVIRLGSLLLVKVQAHGKSRIIVETISPTLMQKLNEAPHLLKDPNVIFELIHNQKRVDNGGEEAEMLYK